jgi:large subunit ribosomal protein L25
MPPTPTPSISWSENNFHDTITSMAKITTKVDNRKIIGRRVKQLRRDGIIPANIYGKKTDSISIQLSLKEFNKLYKEAGETNIIYITVDGEKTERPCLISHIQYNPTAGEVIHSDFHQVDLTQKVTVEVPVELTGESPVTKSGDGTIVLQYNTLEVEALPADLVDKFEIDVTTLLSVGDSVKLSDLKYNKEKLTIDLDPETVIVTAQALTEEKEPEVAIPSEEEEVKEGEEKPSEGEEKKEEVKEDEKPEEKKD